MKIDLILLQLVILVTEPENFLVLFLVFFVSSRSFDVVGAILLFNLSQRDVLQVMIIMHEAVRIFLQNGKKGVFGRFVALNLLYCQLSLNKSTIRVFFAGLLGLRFFQNKLLFVGDSV